MYAKSTLLCLILDDVISVYDFCLMCRQRKNWSPRDFCKTSYTDVFSVICLTYAWTDKLGMRINILISALSASFPHSSGWRTWRNAAIVCFLIHTFQIQLNCSSPHHSAKMTCVLFQRLNECLTATLSKLLWSVISALSILRLVSPLVGDALPATTLRSTFFTCREVLVWYSKLRYFK